MTCPTRGEPPGVWLFDPSGQGRRLEGVEGQSPEALLVRPDGDTWFTVAGLPPSLCHLTGVQARCETIPTSGSWARALGERGADLVLVAGDGLWIYHTCTFNRQPLPMPDGGAWYLATAVRDRQQQIRGVAREQTTRGPGRHRLFRHAP